MNPSSLRTLLVSAAIALPLTLVPGPAMATAVFSAYSEIRLTITGIAPAPPGLFISALTFDDPQESAAGNAMAIGTSLSTVDATDPFDLREGEGISLFASGDGSASAVGSALTDAFTDGEIFFDNQSGGALTMILSLEFDVGANTTVMDPQSEFAFATASVELLGTTFDVFELAQSDSDLGGGPDGFADTYLFEFSLEPDESELITARVSAFATALASPLHEPMMQWMLLLSLLAIRGRGDSVRLAPQPRVRAEG